MEQILNQTQEQEKKRRRKKAFLDTCRIVGVKQKMGLEIFNSVVSSEDLEKSECGEYQKLIDYVHECGYDLGHLQEVGGFYCTPCTELTKNLGLTVSSWTPSGKVGQKLQRFFTHLNELSNNDIGLFVFIDETNPSICLLLGNEDDFHWFIEEGAIKEAPKFQMMSTDGKIILILPTRSIFSLKE